MGSVKERNRKLLGMICLTAAALALAWATPSMAEEQPEQDLPRSQWIDMEKGPGRARWVDENGVISDVPGVKPGQESRQDKDGPGEVQASGESGESQGAFAAGEEQNPQEAAAADEGQPGQEDGGGTAKEACGRAIDPGRPMVALTFDDGPFAPVGNQIMDCLAQYGGKATFYVVGERCASYQAEMQRMAAEGHEIGNHTYSHKYLNKLSAGQIQDQVSRGSEAILAACGVTPATVRLPGGNKNATVVANVHAPIIMWSIDTLDWKTRNTQSTVDKVLGSVKDGDIVLMHELYRATGNAAVQIIPALAERGYQLVTVSELAQYRGGLQSGQIYYAVRP